ncbi:MAG: isoprenylcysteine carboxylmethyltransferase family protein [Anaerolineales bacterium]|nr:isoprenylcysteine carboxylmethyltransferase family protein [Anaerolineales bacterium]
MDIFTNVPPALSPWLILLGFFGYAAGHSIMASNWFKQIAAFFMDKAYDRYYRLVFNAGGTITLLPILAMVALLPDRQLYTIPFPWNLVNFALQGLGALVLLTSLLQTGAAEFLGISQVFAPKAANEPKLVVRGFYKYMRHPLYTASMLFLWATPYLTQNILALNVGITVYFFIGTIFEERKLVQDFGEDYAVYRSQTPRFIPDIQKLIQG